MVAPFSSYSPRSAPVYPTSARHHMVSYPPWGWACRSAQSELYRGQAHWRRFPFSEPPSLSLFAVRSPGSLLRQSLPSVNHCRTLLGAVFFPQWRPAMMTRRGSDLLLNECHTRKDKKEHTHRHTHAHKQIMSKINTSIGNSIATTPQGNIILCILIGENRV